jgi:glycosyltransferase involved in cell wall biosynthesis
MHVPSTPSGQTLRTKLAAWCRQQKVLRVIGSLLSGRALRARLSARSVQVLLADHAFSRTEAWSRILPASEHALPVAQPSANGVNLVGYLRGEFGLAESARMYARALLSARVPVALYDLDLGVPHSMADASLKGDFCLDLPEQVVIIFINPDYFAAAVSEIGEAKLLGKYIIACWFWELERLPETWLPVLEDVDEVMASSGFIADAIRNCSNVPILHAPIPLAEMARADIGRNDFAITTDAFLFLFTFDFNSWIERKNPQAVLEAFRSAFPAGDEKVQLLIKTSNGHLHPELLRELVEQICADPRIVVRNGVITREQLTALQACCDCYVSLHRAEGFGMGMAECMQMGKPVIATGWSGNMEFMNEECAALVGYELVALQPGQYPFGTGQRWAEPDIGQAAEWMARLSSDPVLASQLGERGRQHVERVLSPDRVAGLIAERINAIVSRMPDVAGQPTGFDAQRGQ